MERNSIALILLAVVLLAVTGFAARFPRAQPRYATASGSYLLPELLDFRRLSRLGPPPVSGARKEPPSSHNYTAC